MVLKVQNAQAFTLGAGRAVDDAPAIGREGRESVLVRARSDQVKSRSADVDDAELFFVIRGVHRLLPAVEQREAAHAKDNLPSGDHAGRKSPPWPAVSGRAWCVATSRIQRLAVPAARVVTKTTCLPSGEKAAWSSYAGSSVSRSRPVRSG